MKWVLGLAVVILALPAVIILWSLSTEREPDGGVDSYCYKISYDPRGDGNRAQAVANVKPEHVGQFVILRDVWIDFDAADLSDRYDFYQEIELGSDDDVQIRNFCGGRTPL